MALILFGSSGAGQVYRAGATGGAASSLVTADAAGSVDIFTNPVKSYLMRVPNQILSAVIAANSVIWGIKNGGTVDMLFKRIFIITGFTGTAAATASEYQLLRWSAPGGTNLTGGTALGVAKRASTMVNSSFADARFNYAAALGVAGITIEADAFYSFGTARSIGGASVLDLPVVQVENYQSVVTLKPNEGLLLRLGAASVIGDIIGGGVQWFET